MANSGAGIVCLLLILLTAVPSLATDYTVGDSSGWALSVDYTTWAKDKTLKVGDNLGKFVISLNFIQLYNTYTNSFCY